MALYHLGPARGTGSCCTQSSLLVATPHDAAHHCRPQQPARQEHGAFRPALRGHAGDDGGHREGIDLALGPGKDGVVLQPEGIVAAELNAEQQNALLALIRTRVGITNDPAAAKRMAEIQANLAQAHLVWSGPTTNGSAAYWRIQRRWC